MQKTLHYYVSKGSPENRANRTCNTCVYVCIDRYNICYQEEIESSNMEAEKSQDLQLARCRPRKVHGVVQCESKDPKTRRTNGRNSSLSSRVLVPTQGQISKVLSYPAFLFYSGHQLIRNGNLLCSVYRFKCLTNYLGTPRPSLLDT